LQNAAVGVRRLLARLRPDPERRPVRSARILGQRGIAFVVGLRARLAAAVRPGSDATTRRGRRDARFSGVHAASRGAHRVNGTTAFFLRVRRRVGRARRARAFALSFHISPAVARDRLVPIGVAALLLVASAFSASGGIGASAGTGSVQPGGEGPRLVIGGDVGGAIVTGGGSDVVGTAVGGPDVGPGSSQGVNMAGPLHQPDPTLDPQAGPFLDDGTLLMPVAVDTTVADGSDKLTAYKVKSGDTLTGIANHFGISMMSIWWANNLSSKDQLHIGQTLEIPPVSGLVLTVASGDTLDSVAGRTGVSGPEILAYNGLTDPSLVIGQKLIIPGAVGKAIATPKPAKSSTSSTSSTSHVSSGGGSSARPPSSTYSGGRLLWPVPGGYISQYYHYGHLAIDIAAPFGSRILAAATGTVVFAGYKNDCGGYQVWIYHGSNFYTAYYHMSAVLVGAGQHVARGQQIGRIGMTGCATGPHCHFEVWHGYPWELNSGSYQSNPLNYL
jgi:murein DD-endopeptidase MepM/ murein hydrolase activator NlpD